MPEPFAMNRCRPGSRRTLDVHDALRVTVLPVDVAYTISRPARSTGPAPTFVISANSSDAELPPVWISDTSSVEGGQVTAAVAAPPGSLAAAHAAPPS